MREDVVSVGHPSAGSSINQPSRANCWAASMQHGPLNPVTHIFILRGSRLAGKSALWQESAPQLFTFLGEKVMGEGMGADLVTRKED